MSASPGRMSGYRTLSQAGSPNSGEAQDCRLTMAPFAYGLVSHQERDKYGRGMWKRVEEKEQSIFIRWGC